MTRIRRRAFWVSGVLAFVVLLPLLLLAAANTGPGRTVVEGLINRLLAEDARVTGLSGRVPDRLTVEQLELRDPDGVWLRVGDLRLDWSPSGLLRGRLDIDVLQAARITVERQPSAASGAGDDPVDMAALLPPVDVAVNDLSVPVIDIGAGVLGTPAELTLEATLDIPRDGRAIAVEAKLRRTDAPARADVRLTHDAIANRLSLDIEAEEPDGGLLARLLDLPGLPAVRLRAQGEGPVDDLTLTLQARAGDVVSARARLTLARVENGLRARLAGDAAIAEALPSAYRPLAEPNISFAAALTRSDAGPIDIDSVRVDTDAMRADATGRVDPAGARLSGHVKIAGSLTPFGGLTRLPLQGGFDTRIEFDGDPENVSAAYAVTVRDGGVDGFAARTLSTEGDAIFSASGDGQVGLRGRIAADGLSLDGTPPPVIGDRASGDYAMTIDAAGGLQIASLNATAGPLAGAASGRIGADGALDLTLTAEVADIAAFSKQGLPDLRGSGNGTIRLEGRIDAGLDIALDGRIQRFSTGIAVVDGLAGDRIDYRSSVRYAAAGGFRVESLRMAGDGVTLTGNAALDAAFSDLTADLALVVADMAPLTPALGIDVGGRLDGRVRLRGDPADPAVVAMADWRQARIGGIHGAAVSVAADLPRPVSAPAGDVTASVAWRDIAADARAGLRLDGDTVGVANLRVRGEAVSADADLTVDTTRGLIRGPVTASLPGLRAFSSLAGRDLGGSAEIAATFATDADVQTLSVKLTAAAPRLDGLAAAGLQASADLRRPFDAPAGDLQAVAWEIDVGGQRLRDVGVGAALAGNALDFNLRVNGPESLDAAVEAGGAIGWRDLAVEAVVDRLDGRIAGGALGLAAPVRLSRTDMAVTIADLDLGIGAGRVRGGLDLGTERVAADIAVDALAVGPFVALAGGPAIDGTATARLKLTGTPTAPDLRVALRIADVTLPDQATADLPPVALSAQGAWRDGQATLRAGVEGVDGLTAQLAGNLPLRGDLTAYRFALPETEPLNLRLTIDGDIARLGQLFAPDGHSMAGRFAGEIAVAGTLARPRVDGEGGLTDGFYANDASGFVLRDVGLQLAGDARRLLLKDLAATDDNGGRLSGDGAVTFGENGFGTVDVSVDLTTLRVARIDEVHATTSGDLRLAGPFREMLLSGTLTVDRADIEIPGRLPVSVSSIEVTEINLPPDRRAERTRAATPPTVEDEGDVRLDVTVDLPGQVFVRGRGLDSEWRGGFEVGGWLRRPMVDGQLEIVRGTFALAGRSFEFQRGLIDVSTSARGNVDAGLDLRAAAQAADITAEVRIDGPVLRPDVTLQSTPPLPQDEILSRVLFGKNVGSLSAVQAFQLGQSALVLSGRLGSGGIVSDIRRSLGLDALDIESGEGEGVGSATLKAGKYITDNVYLGMRQGLTAQSSRAVLEYKVLPWLSLESSVGATADSDIGVTLERRY